MKKKWKKRKKSEKKSKKNRKKEAQRKRRVIDWAGEASTFLLDAEPVYTVAPLQLIRFIFSSMVYFHVGCGLVRRPHHLLIENSNIITYTFQTSLFLFYAQAL